MPQLVIIMNWTINAIVCVVCVDVFDAISWPSSPIHSSEPCTHYLLSACELFIERCVVVCASFVCSMFVVRSTHRRCSESLTCDACGRNERSWENIKSIHRMDAGAVRGGEGRGGVVWCWEDDADVDWWWLFLLAEHWLLLLLPHYVNAVVETDTRLCPVFLVFHCLPHVWELDRPIIIRLEVDNDEETSFFPREWNCYCLSAWHLSPNASSFVCGIHTAVCTSVQLPPMRIRLKFACHCNDDNEDAGRREKNEEAEKHISHNVAFCQ